MNRGNRAIDLPSRDSAGVTELPRCDSANLSERLAARVAAVGGTVGSLLEDPRVYELIRCAFREDVSIEEDAWPLSTDSSRESLVERKIH